jgi:hypothetical protein
VDTNLSERKPDFKLLLYPNKIVADKISGTNAFFHSFSHRKILYKLLYLKTSFRNWTSRTLLLMQKKYIVIARNIKVFSITPHYPTQEVIWTYLITAINGSSVLWGMIGAFTKGKVKRNNEWREKLYPFQSDRAGLIKIWWN